MTLLPSMRTKEQLLEDEKALLAEIELLKKRVRDLEQERRNLRAAMDLREEDHREKTAEIERLRNDPEYFFAFQNGWNARNAEIEQLKAENNWFRQAGTTRDAEDQRTLDAYKAEIERLRTACRDLYFDLEGDTQHFEAWLEGRKL